MGITRPTGEQLRFRSQYTGDHILDTYLESSEKGSRQLSDLLDDLFDSNGTFRSGNFEFRFDASSDKIQFRAGNFASSTTGWTDITTFFNITGAFNASTTYNNFDLITLTNKDVYIVHGLSSGTTFADEAAVIASANTEKLVDVSEARDWASKTTGQVVSTDYSAKAYAVGGTGIDTTTGSAKDWAIKTSGTIGNTGEYSAKYWATSTAVTTVSSGIANINTVAASIANVNTVASDIANVNTVAGISANVTSVANIDTDVTTVAGISANTTTVAGIAPNVTTVAGVATNVTTVAGISGNVTTVANNSTNVTTVATNVADVNTVAGEINNNNLQTVANDIQAVITLADDLNEATSEIDTVANSITNVDTVGNDITNVNTVATNIANVNTSATNIANVNTVAGISANVTTVAGISTDVTTTATNNANITTVAGISSNVTTVAGISSNVTTVAGIAADVTTAATNVVAFNNTYLGAQSTAPTADPDGSALDLGDLYFDTTSNTMKVYSSSGWTNAGSSVNGTADRFTYTATAGQTTFTGADDSNNTLAYDAGFIDIYMNGVKLAPADYTATSGTSVVLASGAALNDVLEMIAYGTFTLSNQSINDMTDVSTSGVANNNLLAYNSTNSQFEPVSSINFGDNDKAIFGAGNDLEIYHDGLNSYVKDSGTGDLYLQGSANVRITNASGQKMFLGQDGGEAQLYYSGVEKLATNSTGIDVTGTNDGETNVAIVNTNAGSAAQVRTKYQTDGGLFTVGKTSDAHAYGGDAYVHNVDNTNIRFATNDTERMRLTSSGSLLLGHTNNTYAGDLVFNADATRTNVDQPSGANINMYSGNSNHLIGMEGGGMYFTTDQQMRHYYKSGATWANLFTVASGGSVFNEDGGNQDFRVESTNQQHMLFLDASANSIGIRKSSPDSSYVIDSSGSTRFEDGTMTLRNSGEAGPHTYRSGNSGNDFRFFSTNGTFSAPTAKTDGSAVGQIHWAGYDGAQYLQCASVTVTVDGSVSSGNMPMRMGFHTGTTGASERMRIEAGGKIMMNTTGLLSNHSSGRLQIDGGSQHGLSVITGAPSGTFSAISCGRNTSGAAVEFHYQNSTNVGKIDIDSTSTTYLTTSDRRLKTDIQPIEHATDMLMAMNPVTHRWKADPDADAVVGFIAQEMQEIVPEAVSGEPEGEEMMSMDYGRITPVLVAALQDAHRKIEELSAEIQALKGA